MQHEILFKQLTLVLQSKCEELFLYDYKGVTKEDLWEFCVEYKWRKRNITELRMYEMVATILSITQVELMQYSQLKAYREQPSIVQFNFDELNMLLGYKE